MKLLFIEHHLLIGVSVSDMLMFRICFENILRAFFRTFPFRCDPPNDLALRALCSTVSAVRTQQTGWLAHIAPRGNPLLPKWTDDARTRDQRALFVVRNNENNFP